MRRIGRKSGEIIVLGCQQREKLKTLKKKKNVRYNSHLQWDCVLVSWNVENPLDMYYKH